MGARIAISKDVIPWIRTMAGPTAPADVLSRLDQWSQGRKATLAQIGEASRKLHVPFGYFFLKEPVETQSASPLFRTFGNRLARQISVDLRDTIQKMETIQEWLRDYADEQALTDCAFAGIVDADNIQAEAVATRLRHILSIDVDWNRRCTSAQDAYRTLRAAIGDTGAYVFENGIVELNTTRKLDIGEFRAFCLYDKRVPLIFINAADTHEGKLFSLVHEMVHIALGEDDLMTPSRLEEERFCNSVAAELLMPRQDFMSFWATRTNGLSISTAVEKAAGKFRTSVTATAIRAKEFDLISRSELESILETVKTSVKKRRLRSGGGDFYTTAKARLDNNFLFMLYGSIQAGHTSYTEAYRLTGCKGDVFDKLIHGVVEWAAPYS